MAVSSFLNEHRLAGFVLILSFVTFAIGAGLPTIGAKGNMGIYDLPMREQLLAIAGNAGAWRWANIFMGAAAVVLVAGLTMLTTILEGAGERVLSRLGIAGILLAAISWLVFSAFRGTVMISAAQETVTAGQAPPYYEPLAQWGYGLFYVYASVGILAVAAFGGSVISAGLLPAWAGWATIIFSVGVLAMLLITGDTLPIFHYLPPLLLGILLMLRG